MERNPNDGFGGTSDTGLGAGSTGSGAGSLGGSAGGAGSYGGASGAGTGGTLDDVAATSGAGGIGSTAAGSTGLEREHGTETHGVRDRLHHARDAAGQKLGQARERAGELKATLADKLEAGADRLRQRSAGSATGATGTTGTTGYETGSPAYATGAAETTAQRDQLANVSDRLASGMQSTAQWLRNNDLDSMRTGIEREVRANPGRSLLIAAVAGYVLGKAFRR
jgi:hypothetical protein